MKVMVGFGFKKLSESEIGNDSSHQTHIGLYSSALIQLSHHQTIQSKLYYEKSVFNTVAFIDFIQNKDGTLRSPKIRRGNDDDNFYINGVKFQSTYVKLLDLIHKESLKKDWYIIFHQLNEEEIDFYLMSQDSEIYKEIKEKLPFVEDTTLTEKSEIGVLNNILSAYTTTAMPPHGIKNVWWNEEEVVFMVNPGKESFEKTILINKPFLWAPYVGPDNKPHQNTMVALVKKGNIILVYNDQSIVGYLEAKSNVYKDVYDWTLGGEKGKKKGLKLKQTGGFKVDLDDFVEFEVPINLSDIRKKEFEILKLRDQLREKHKTIYFPFNHSSGPRADKKKVLMAKEGYLSKFPNDLVKILGIDIQLDNKDIDTLDKKISYEVQISSEEYNTYVTNRTLRDEVITIYDGKCQICNKKYDYINSAGELKVYAEGAHVKAKNPKIGGKDSLNNLMCLCASCHALFDLGALWVDEEVTVRDIYGEVVNQLTVKHDIDESNFEFHRDYFENRRNLN